MAGDPSALGWRLVKRRSLLLAAAPALAQNPATLPDPFHRDRDVKLPSGKSQRDEILKADHERNIEEAKALAKLTDEIRADIEKSDRFILPAATLKKLDEAEKLVKKIRTRLRRY